jgi:hypothetical protein
MAVSEGHKKVPLAMKNVKFQCSCHEDFQEEDRIAAGRESACAVTEVRLPVDRPLPTSASALYPRWPPLTCSARLE